MAGDLGELPRLQGVTDPSWVDAVTGVWIVLVVVEFGSAILRAMSRHNPAWSARPASSGPRASPGELVEVSHLVGDAGVLARAWLQHADSTGLVLYRLPAGGGVS